MKIVLSMIVVITCSTTLQAQSALTLPTNGDNQKTKIIQAIGPVQVSIEYSGPNVHGPDGTDRKDHIWGEVVPYGLNYQGFGISKEAPWRAGSNENTVVSLSHDVLINGKSLKAGIYGFFIIVEKDKPWTLIFSKNYYSWGSAFYNPTEDVLRIECTPELCQYTEWLTYGFDDRLPSSATAFLQWEYKRCSFKIEVPDINNIYVEKLHEELLGALGFSYEHWTRAAQFCINNKVNLEEASTWCDNAMNLPFVGKKNFLTFSTKSQVLYMLGRFQEADSLMRIAIDHPTSTAIDIYAFGRSILFNGKPKEALQIFKLNAAKNPDSKFLINLGLGRAYGALNDKKNAIKHWELAIKYITDEFKNGLPYYEQQLKDLKEQK